MAKKKQDNIKSINKSISESTQQKLVSSKVERHFYRYGLKETVFQSTDEPYEKFQLPELFELKKLIFDYENLFSKIINKIEFYFFSLNIGF